MPRILYLLLLILLPCACAKEESVPIGAHEYGQIDLLIYPSQPTTKSRASDPGHDVGDADVWDRLVLCVVYDDATPPKDGHKFLRYELSRAEFDRLPTFTGNSGLKHFPLRLLEGRVYLYGIAYPSQAAGANELKAQIDACKTKKDIEALTLSNDFASTPPAGTTTPPSTGTTPPAGTTTPTTRNVAQFLSVATGYYQGSNLQGNQGSQPNPPSPTGPLASIEVKASLNEITPVSVLRLFRLATLFDIQWDAADAFDPNAQKNITDVRVTEIKLIGDPTIVGQGAGRLFPALAGSQTPQAKPLLGTTGFHNTTPISQRNGRAYHYFYPDGVTTPKMGLTITGKQGGVQQPTPWKIVLDLKQPNTSSSAPIQQAAWYKVNATIKGLQGSVTFK